MVSLQGHEPFGTFRSRGSASRLVGRAWQGSPTCILIGPQLRSKWLLSHLPTSDQWEGDLSSKATGRPHLGHRAVLSPSAARESRVSPVHFSFSRRASDSRFPPCCVLAAIREHQTCTCQGPWQLSNEPGTNVVPKHQTYPCFWNKPPCKESHSTPPAAPRGTQAWPPAALPTALWTHKTGCRGDTGTLTCP